jgi:hypothetical protein
MIPDQFLLNCSSLTPDEHTLVLQHNGTVGVPLTVHSFMVASLTLDEQASLSAATSQTQAFSGHRHLRGAVVGAIIGSSISFLVMVGIFLTFWRKTRSGQADCGLEPTPFVEVTERSFDPYEATESHSSPHKRSRNLSLRGQNAMMNHRLRWGNLKLQQRVAILLGRQHSSPSGNVASMRELRPIEPVIRTDSGWRMRQEDLVSNHSDEIREVPPNYTEM